MLTVIDHLDEAATAAAVDVNPDAVVHVENARWVEVAVPLLDGLCVECHVAVDPSWTWLDPDGAVRGFYQRGRCRSCGQESTGWLCSGERDMRGLSIDDVRTVVAGTTNTVTRLRDRHVNVVRQRTHTRLAEMIDEAVLAVRSARVDRDDPGKVRNALSGTRTPLVDDEQPGLHYRQVNGAWRFVATCPDKYTVGGTVELCEPEG